MQRRLGRRNALPYGDMFLGVHYILSSYSNLSMSPSTIRLITGRCANLLYKRISACADDFDLGVAMRLIVVGYDSMPTEVSSSGGFQS